MEEMYMGLDADVIGIGKFVPEIAGILDYRADYYIDTKPGTTVLTTVFSCNTSNNSFLLAGALGVELWDFETHKIDLNKINQSALLKWTQHQADAEPQDIIDFYNLALHGFEFYFRPNG